LGCLSGKALPSGNPQAAKPPIWFVVLLVVNTLGILEILYIFVFSKLGIKKKSSLKSKTRDK